MKINHLNLVKYFTIAALVLLPLGSAQAQVPAVQPAASGPVISQGAMSAQGVVSAQGAAASQGSQGPVVSPASPASSIYNTNLIPDGDAETIPYTAYWHDNEHFTQILPYGADCGGMCNFPSPYDVGPIQRGANFYYLGSTDNDTNGNNMWLNSRISLAPIQSVANTGRVRYVLSGYFGGDTFEDNTACLRMFFETSSGVAVGSGAGVAVGNVTPADRQNKTGLLYREIRGTLPAGTQDINLALQSCQLNGSHWRTGYADNLSLVLLPQRVYLPFEHGAGTVQPPPKSGMPAPTGVVVTPNGLTRLDIKWTDNSNSEQSFQVQRINADSSVDTVCNTKPNVTDCLDPGVSQSAAYGYVYLGNHKTYTYQVRAVGAGINSAWASGTGTTAAEPAPSNPPAPSYGAFTCQAVDVTSTTATFVWNDPFNYEAGFNIYLGNNNYASWSMLEGGTKITFINQTPGTSITLKIVPFIYDQNDPAYVYQSSTSCTATADLPQPPSEGSVTKFQNTGSYPVISLVVDGWEQLPVSPLAVLSGAYYELDGVPAGKHTWTASTGFWDDWGRRFIMYNYAGTYTQGSTPLTVTIPDMTINALLAVPPANKGYWEGYYFDQGANCHTVAFIFAPNGTYKFYNANILKDTGTYSLVKKETAIFSDDFRVTDTGGSLDGLLIETGSEFFLKNGPAGWTQITYTFKAQGYVRNPFCP